MGINIQALKLILHENSLIPLYGKILLIGRSTVTIDYATVKMLFRQFTLKPPIEIRNRSVTKHQNSIYGVDDRALFSAISSKITEIDVLDVSNYEGANIIFDLNTSAPATLRGKYDFIYDSSVLDNLFNPAQALVNISNMLSGKGRYIGLNVASFYPGAMVSCHPEWFYSFFAANSYRDVKVYLAWQREQGPNRFEYRT